MEKFSDNLARRCNNWRRNVKTLQLKSQFLKINSAQMFVGSQHHPATGQRGFGQNQRAVVFFFRNQITFTQPFGDTDNLPMADRDKTNQLEIPSAMLSQKFSGGVSFIGSFPEVRRVS
jgi:hypothetical protein